MQCITLHYERQMLLSKSGQWWIFCIFYDQIITDSLPENPDERYSKPKNKNIEKTSLLF